jgi:hypothetical protein
MATTRNNFGLLNTTQEPTQIIAQAARAAKNRKNKERAKQRRAAKAEKRLEDGDQKENGSTTAQSSKELGALDGERKFEAVCEQFLKDASTDSCWTIWLQQVLLVIVCLRSNKLFTGKSMHLMENKQLLTFSNGQVWYQALFRQGSRNSPENRRTFILFKGESSFHIAL